MDGVCGIFQRLKYFMARNLLIALLLSVMLYFTTHVA